MIVGIKKIYAYAILVLVSSCEETAKQSDNLLQLNSKKEMLIEQIDSLSQLLNSVELNISKLDTTKRLTTVNTIKAQRKLFQHFIEVQGTVEAEQSVELYPESSGSIINIFVEEGQNVYKGQTLIQIDNSVLKTNMREKF